MNLKMIFEKYKTAPVQVKASFWYTLCNILQKGISFLVVPIYVRLLTTGEYGQYSVFQSWKEILIIFATLNLYCGVFTKAMVDYVDDRDRYTSCMQGLSTSITFALFVVYLLSKDIWGNILKMDHYIIVLMFVYFVTFPAFSFWSVRQRVENKYAKMVMVTMLTSVMTPLISILLLVCTSLRSEAVILGYLFVQCGVGSFFYVYHFCKSKHIFVKEYWIKAIKFNIPLIPHYLSLIVLAQSDKVMIRYYCGDDKVGIYNLAYQISMIMNVIVSAVNNTFVPWTYDKLKNENIEAIKNISSKICLAFMVCTLGIILIAPEIISIIGTSAYREAIWIIPAIAISCYLTFVYGLFSNVEFYFSATKYVPIASGIGATLNIILNTIFIPIFGFIAAGYTTLACYFVFMIMHYIFMKKVCEININGKIPYNTLFLMGSAVLLIIVGIIFMVLYNFTLVRYIIILIVLLIMFIKRNYFIKLIKEIR